MWKELCSSWYPVEEELNLSLLKMVQQPPLPPPPTTTSKMISRFLPPADALRQPLGLEHCWFDQDWTMLENFPAAAAVAFDSAVASSALPWDERS